MLMGDIPTLIDNVKTLPNRNLRGGSSSVSKNDGINTFINFNSSIVNDPNIDGKACFSTSVNFVVMNEFNEINSSELNKATYDIINNDSINDTDLDIDSEINQKLVKYALNNSKVDEEGRIQMPLLWRSDVKSHLGNNFELAKAVLDSNFNKYKKKDEYLQLIDNSFKEQENLNIIERIDDLDNFVKLHPEASFLPHMGVFRLNRQTTKCRVVLLSNMCQKKTNSLTVSHNQAMYSGPSLNNKLSSAILNLRFNSKLLIFDLRKAFSQISLSAIDSVKLICLWYRNVS